MDWDEVKRLFHEALERGRSVLDGVDPEVRAEVESLLKSHDEGPGTRIGPYKLLQQIGEGGFGVVYMAEQTEPVRRKVALKIIKLGMDTKQVVARFEAERQALAMMDHPHIAKVLDGGATDTGRPYFVMELVKGVPITEYCDQAQLDTSARLQLFQPVCHAVQHAHQKGIIHRDLKPSNVMVTLHDGVPVPKVIDFGIAKATDHRLTEKTLFTEFRQMIGTPEYMAPEQAELSGLDIDTRADVYSLGVLLYELLTGTKPFDLKTLMEKGYEEILRTIREVDPPKPSTRISTMGEELTAVAQRRHTPAKLLGRLFRGDLDWIVMKALEKDRSRRYETANGLAMDIGRFLQDQPVLASPPGAAYRLKKYLRRHRVGVTLAAVVFLGLAAGGGVAFAGMRDAQVETTAAREAGAEARMRRELAAEARRRETKQRERAERGAAEAETETLRAEAVLDFVNEMLGSADPHETKGANYTVRQLLDDFDKGLGDRLEGQPVIEADIRATIGSAYRGLGMYRRAAPHLETALAIQERLDDDAALAHRLFSWALLLHDRADYREAERCMRRALGLYRAVHGEAHPSVAMTLQWLGDLTRHQARLDESERAASDAVALQRRLHGDNHPNVAASLRELALVHAERGDDDAARPMFEQALAIRRTQLGDEHPQTAASLVDLAGALTNADEDARAEKLLREALRIRRKVLGAEHPEVAATLADIADARRNQGDWTGAEELSREAVGLLQKTLGHDHPRTVKALGRLANILRQRGAYDEAEKHQREALGAAREAFGERHPEVGWHLNQLGRILDYRGKYAEAESCYRGALERWRAVYGDDHSNVAAFLNNLAGLQQRMGHLDTAVEMYREALAIRRRAHGDRHTLVALGLNNLGLALKGRGDFEAALEHFREALAIEREVFPPDHPELAYTLGNLAVGFQDLGEYGRAQELYSESLAILRKALGDRHIDVAQTLHNLGTLHIDFGRLDPAEQCLREALGIQLAILGEDHLSTARTFGSLGVVLMHKGDLDGATELGEKALAIRRRQLGEDHPDVARSHDRIGEVCQARGDAAGAEEHYEKARAIWREKVPADHPARIGNLVNLAMLAYERQDHAKAVSILRECLAVRRDHFLLALCGVCLVKQGEHVEAEKILRECLAGRRSELGGDHWATRNAMSLLGASLLGQKRYAEAEPLLVEGYEKMNPPPPAAARKTEALERVITLYEAWEKPEKAAEWRAKR